MSLTPLTYGDNAEFVTKRCSRCSHPVLVSDEMKSIDDWIYCDECFDFMQILQKLPVDVAADLYWNV